MTTSREVWLVLGPPGTGKTTYLLSRVDELLERGVPSHRIAFFSFSKRAVAEAQQRAQQRFGLLPSDLPWFRTIHSCAYTLLGLSRDEVVQPRHLRELGQRISLPLATATDQVPGQEIFSAALGSRAMQLIQLAAARRQGLEATWRAAQLPDTPWHVVYELDLRYRQYKRAHFLVDFADMLELALGGPPLPVDALFLDEAQDSSLAQWTFVRQVARDVPFVMLAGDDDQAIFEWSGAAPHMLEQLEGTRHVLPVSYRLPRRIKALADQIVQRIPHRLPKLFLPREEQGRVEYVGDPAQVNLHDAGSWLLLARSNYQLRELRELARAQGVVYSVEGGGWSWGLPSVQAALTYERLRAGKVVTADAARKLRAFTGRPLAEPPDDAEVVEWATVFRDARATAPTWLDALDKLPASDREYIRALRQHGESLTGPGRVRISTVHSAKGAEAQQVLVLPELSARVERGRQVDPDAEHRVHYVALTRASERLVLPMPRGRFHWTH